MNRLEFVAALVGHVMWPLAVVVIFLLIRKPLQEHVLPRLLSYEGMGQKLHFGGLVASAEEAVEIAVDRAESTEEAGSITSGPKPQEDTAPETVETTPDDTETPDAREDEPPVGSPVPVWAEEVSDASVRASEAASAQRRRDLDRRITASQVDAQEAVYVSWNQFRRALGELLHQVLFDLPEDAPRLLGHPTLTKQLQLLHSIGVVDGTYVNAAQELRQVSNKVRFGHKPSESEAFAFMRSAEELTELTNRLRRRSVAVRARNAKKRDEARDYKQAQTDAQRELAQDVHHDLAQDARDASGQP